MAPERRRLMIGLALLAAVAGFGWSYWSAGRGAPAGTQGGAAGVRRPAQGGATGTLPPAEEVRLASLAQQRDEPSAATRNPFKFGRRPGATPRLAEDAAEIPPAPPPVEPMVPSGPPPPPPIPLKFIGVLEKSGGLKWAVLSGGDGRGPLHGKEGDIIDGRYRILKIGTESIDMIYLDGRGRQTIRLTGQ